MIAAPPVHPTRTRYAVLLFIYLAAFITYLDRVCLSVATPAMQADLGISRVEFGWVFTVFYIAYAVAEMPTSWLGDRWGQRLMLVRIVGCWSIFTILTGLARSFTTVLVTRTVFGESARGRYSGRGGKSSVRVKLGCKGWPAPMSPVCYWRARKVELHWYEAHGIGKEDLKIKGYTDEP